MTALRPEAPRSPDMTGVCRAGRSAHSQCEMATGPGFSSPNQPDQERTTAYRDSSGPNSRSDAHCATLIGDGRSHRRVEEGRAVAWAVAASPRFPSPLIKPDVPISGIIPRHTAAGRGGPGAAEARRAHRRSCRPPGRPSGACRSQNMSTSRAASCSAGRISSRLILSYRA